MCELLAIGAREPVPANELLREFFADSVDHPHGWGLSWYDGARTELFKEPVRAVDSVRLARMLEHPIQALRLLAHIRNATRGIMSLENCHPFLGHDVYGRPWVLAHNGTVLDDTLIAGVGERALGQTDSERVLLVLLDRIDRASEERRGPLDADERMGVVGELVSALSPASKLNLIIDDGERIYAHTNTCAHTLYIRHVSAGVVLCTRPLGDDGGWEPMEQCRLHCFEDGRLVAISPSHGHHFDDGRYLELLAAEGHDV